MARLGRPGMSDERKNELWERWHAGEPVDKIAFRDPLADRLDAVAELGSDPLHRAVLGAEISSQLPHETNALILARLAVATRRRLPR